MQYMLWVALLPTGLCELPMALAHARPHLRWADEKSIMTKSNCIHDELLNHGCQGQRMQVCLLLPQRRVKRLAAAAATTTATQQRPALAAARNRGPLRSAEAWDEHQNVCMDIYKVLLDGFMWRSECAALKRIGLLAWSWIYLNLFFFVLRFFWIVCLICDFLLLYFVWVFSFFFFNSV